MTRTAADLVDELRAEGIELKVEGDKLRVRGRDSRLTAARVTEITRRKADLLVFLQGVETHSGPCAEPAGEPEPQRDLGAVVAVGCTRSRRTSGSPATTDPPGADSTVVIMTTVADDLNTEASVARPGLARAMADNCASSMDTTDFGIESAAREMFGEDADRRGNATFSPWLPRPRQLASWPIWRRQAWGLRVNELEDQGLHWKDAERQAYLEVRGRKKDKAQFPMTVALDRGKLVVARYGPDGRQALLNLE